MNSEKVTSTLSLTSIVLSFVNCAIYKKQPRPISEIKMVNYKKHGKPPYQILTLHGGPGAPGDMEPVAKELSRHFGVLEPFQTKTNIRGLILELKEAIQNHCKAPVKLVGHSWGAWLAYLFAADYPDLVEKMIMVGTPPFREKFAGLIMETRINRLSEKEQSEIHAFLKKIQTSPIRKGEALTRFLKLIFKADTYEPLSEIEEPFNFEPELFEPVWKEAEALRKSGELLNRGGKIACPVLAIHGDYDPHPAKGMVEPLSSVLKDFRFFELEKCGHSPWKEKWERERFFEILKRELSNQHKLFDTLKHIET